MDRLVGDKETFGLEFLILGGFYFDMEWFFRCFHLLVY